MTTDELVTQLTFYIGRQCQITSDVRGAGLPAVQWHPERWPTLTAVDRNNGTVWCHTNDGISFAVVPDGLVIELAPAVGTMDFASGADRIESIATAIRRYGPTPGELRQRCHCATCKARWTQPDSPAQPSKPTCPTDGADFTGI